LSKLSNFGEDRITLTDKFVYMKTSLVWKAENAAVGFDVLTTCQPSTVWYSRERLPAAAAQPAQGLSEL
jgi:hypothetical protein